MNHSIKIKMGAKNLKQMNFPLLIGDTFYEKKLKRTTLIFRNKTTKECLDLIMLPIWSMFYFFGWEKNMLFKIAFLIKLVRCHMWLEVWLYLNRCLKKELYFSSDLVALFFCLIFFVQFNFWLSRSNQIQHWQKN